MAFKKLTKGILITVGLATAVTALGLPTFGFVEYFKNLITSIVPTSPSVPDIPLIQLQKGGNIPYSSNKNNSLRVSNYLEIVKLLKINEYTNYSTFTDVSINKILHSSDIKYANLNLKILNYADISSTTRTFSLLITGKYLETDVQPEQIVISNIPNFSNNFYVTNNPRINKSLFINDKQNQITAKTWNIQNFLKYNGDIEISFRNDNSDNNKFSLLELYKNRIINSITIKSGDFGSDRQWHIELNINNYTYNDANAIWVPVSANINLNNYIMKDGNFNQWAVDLLANDIDLINNQDPTIYASTEFLNWKRKTADFNKYFNFENSYLSYLNPTNLPINQVIRLDATKIEANDNNGLIYGDFTLVPILSTGLVSRNFNAVISDFAVAVELFNEINLNQNNNLVAITNKSTFFNNIIADLKIPENKKSIETQLNNGYFATIEKPKFINSFATNLPNDKVIFNNFYNNAIIGTEENTSLNVLSQLNVLGINFHALNNQSKSLLTILSENNKAGLFNNLFVSSIKIIQTTNNLVTITKSGDGLNYIISTDITLKLSYQAGKSLSNIDINFKTQDITIPIGSLI